MSNIHEIKSLIVSSISVKQELLSDEGLLSQLDNLVSSCLLCLKSGGKIIFAGNGGSFADAQHLSAEFTSRFLFDRAPLASVALGTNNSALSSMANDYGYDKTFSRELQAIGKKDDVFIPISTSGHSPNIIAAVDKAKELGLTTVVLTGKSGGKLRGNSDCICIPSDETPRIQECHILIGHILCGLVEAKYFNEKNAT
ncbi:SIS domain-containing protein [Lentilitoribacter sp. Alg239-R112]|uniref:D-sedoheptulose-7-phosphate isomerase n=1 Tax=Lentilitoribacter sp. Alg239-R112 TaxID=2305987 RepID=UPI0013A6E09B|nr:SIS domain-containing protein [Lentilitoribacter sp. Alg239-R112]